MEGDGHARLRRLVAPAFTPASANRLRPTMRDRRQRADRPGGRRGRVRAGGRRLRALPHPDHLRAARCPARGLEALLRLGHRHLPHLQRQPGRGPAPHRAGGATSSTTYVSDMIAERRTDPRADLLSDLIAIEEEGDRLVDRRDVDAGRGASSWPAPTPPATSWRARVALFAEHPDQWALLAEQPELAPRAVEESMRYLGAVRGTVRFASEDVVYRDVLFPQGTLVSTSLAGANRDPDAFEDPERLRHHPRARHRPDDLRRRYPLLHGGRAGPRRAPGGPAAPGAAHAGTGAERRRRVEARRPSASGDRPGSRCASTRSDTGTHLPWRRQIPGRDWRPWLRTC